ncbi:hypothetical protein BC834DRAFT_388285 [Gloeopeniophorella convolvens]|nr:hypothetical protein BC834DRAFT_388285 [Gloeopeniophorella convolvens]
MQTAGSPGVVAQSEGNILGPAIVGLFVQGFEAGLVLSQLSTFIQHGENMSRKIVALVAFVTIVGFVQVGFCFSDAWRIYVHGWGTFVVPGWMENMQSIFSLLMAAPVQCFLIWRCSHMLKWKLYVVTPFALLLIGSIVATILTAVHAFHIEAAGAYDPSSHPVVLGVYYPWILCIAFPAVLDIALTTICKERYILADYPGHMVSLPVLNILLRSLKHIYNAHFRQRVTHIIRVVWQAAVPPTLFAIGIIVIYLIYKFHLPKTRQLWYPVLQAMIGKLYVLSLLFNLNAHARLADVLPTTATQVSTLTEPYIGNGVSFSLHTSTHRLQRTGVTVSSVWSVIQPQV